MKIQDILPGKGGGDVGEGIWDLLPALPLEFGFATLPLPRKIMREIAEK